MVVAMQRSTDLCFTVQLAPAASVPWSYFTPSCGQEIPRVSFLLILSIAQE